MLRPVLVCLALAGGLPLAGCGMVEGDPHRFEGLAQRIAEIPVDGQTRGAAVVMAPAPALETQTRTTDAGMRPALTSALRVEVMDPHDLWDARDGVFHAKAPEAPTSNGGLRGLVERGGARVAEAAAPIVARAAVQQASDRIQAGTSQLRPALSLSAPEQPARARRVAATQSQATQPHAVIQLGAYSTEAGARSAWSRIKGGAAHQALAGLSPMFEAVEVNGRTLTRLKVAAPAAAATAICRAAQVADPWCARSA